MERKSHRDVAVAIQAQQLQKSGIYYDKMVELYGCVCFKNDGMHYLVDDNADNIYSVIFEGISEDVLALECVRFDETFDMNLYSEREIARLSRRSCEKTLRDIYSQEMCLLVLRLFGLENEDTSASILYDYFFTQQSFDHILVRQTCLWALKAKILKKESYDMILTLTDQPIERRSVAKTVYGCAYRSLNGSWQFMINANKAAFLELYLDLYRSNYLVSPYWYKAYDKTIPGVTLKEKFANELKQVFTKEYLQAIDVLLNLFNIHAKKILDVLRYEQTSERDLSLLNIYRSMLHLNEIEQLKID